MTAVTVECDEKSGGRQSGCRDLALRASSSAGALRPQYLLNLGPNFVVLHKLPTISGRQANIHRLDEADVVLQISAQDLLRQFVGFQASLGRDLGKLRFLFGLQTYFHRFSLGRFATAVKPSPQSSVRGGNYAFGADDLLAGEKSTRPLLLTG
jgi:hypothetical protein